MASFKEHAEHVKTNAEILIEIWDKGYTHRTGEILEHLAEIWRHSELMIQIMSGRDPSARTKIIEHRIVESFDAKDDTPKPDVQTAWFMRHPEMVIGQIQFVSNTSHTAGEFIDNLARAVTRTCNENVLQGLTVLARSQEQTIASCIYSACTIVQPSPMNHYTEGFLEEPMLSILQKVIQSIYSMAFGMRTAQYMDEYFAFQMRYIVKTIINTRYGMVGDPILKASAETAKTGGDDNE